MRISIRFPIGAKVATVSVVLLLLAMVPTAYVTTANVKRTATDREKDANDKLAESRASEVALILERFVENIRFVGPLLLQESQSLKGEGMATTARFRPFVEHDADIVSLDFYRRGPDGTPKVVESIVNSAYLKGFKEDRRFLELLDRQRPFPAFEAFDKKVLVKNRSLVGKPPLFTLGLPIIVDDATQKVSVVVVANIRLAAIGKPFAGASARTVFLVDRGGTVFAHPEEKMAVESRNLKQLEIVKQAASAQGIAGQLRYYKREAREHFISAFHRVGSFPLFVISEAAESNVLAPAEEAKMLVFRATMIALSLSFLIAAAMSLSITKPIQRLVLITKEIARGNFGLQVARLVPTNDEIGTLATGFDAMLAGLRERDKVKTLFSKFHGSSVTESLLSTEKVQTGGTRKKVVVFFSDIRGFTATSESNSPEQVVSMLNEYFSIMVRIILSHHGIVDKFIGDAIMAIWGAPKGRPDDTLHAVLACMEMRKALADLNERRLARKEAPMMIGIGLHRGEAISGQIGSEERMEYTVIGDTVNMASRIEASTKAFGADLLISETVADEVKDHFILEEAGRSKVKGKAEPIVLFKVRGIVHANGMQEIIKTAYSDYAAEKADKVEVV